MAARTAAVAGIHYTTWFGMIAVAAAIGRFVLSPAAVFSPGAAFVSLAHTAILTWIMLRARTVGWTLAGAVIAVYAATAVADPLVQAWIVGARSVETPGGATIQFAGTLVAAVFLVPAAVWLLDRGGPPGTGERFGPPPPASPALLLGGAILAGLVVPILLVGFEFVAAWSSPDVRSFLTGSPQPFTLIADVSALARGSPEALMLLVVRGGIWVASGALILQMVRAGPREAALLCAAALAVLPSAHLMVPGGELAAVPRLLLLAGMAPAGFLAGLAIARTFGQARSP